MFFLNNHRTVVQKENAMLTEKGLRTSESLKCQLTSCEKNQKTEYQSEYNNWNEARLTRTSKAVTY